MKGAVRTTKNIEKKELSDRLCRYFRIAGITVCVRSDPDFDGAKFAAKLESFAVSGPGEDNVTLRHYIGSPDLGGKDLGKELYRKAPWAISRSNGTWYYREMAPLENILEEGRFAEFSADYTRADIFISPPQAGEIRAYGFPSLALLTTDQIWLAPLLADRQALLLHAAGIVLNGKGLLFIGPSSTGKSTVTSWLKNAAATGSCKAEILCDDRTIARRWNDGWRIHGTWSPGDIPDLSSSSATICAVMFLQQDERDEITPLSDRWEIRKRLFTTIIKPMATADWWRKQLDAMERLIAEAPFYLMRFTKSGAIVALLLSMAAERENVAL